MPPPAPPRRQERAYWVLALACSVVALAADIVDHTLRSDLLFGVGAVVLFVAARRGLIKHAVAVPMHIAIGMSLIVWETRFGAGHTGAMTLADQAQATFLTLGTFGMGVFAGRRGLALGVFLACLAHYVVPSPLLAIVLSVLTGVTGVVVYEVLEALQASREQLAKLAFVDALTGLPNRRAAELQFQTYRSISERSKSTLTVIAWDLDRLKQVNDSKGHAAGDAYIADFSRYLRSCLRSGDAAFRIGGDEFLSFHLDVDDAAHIVARVRTNFEHVSVGWAKREGEDLPALLEKADARMYQDKETRRNRERSSKRA